MHSSTRMVVSFKFLLRVVSARIAKRKWSGCPNTSDIIYVLAFIFFAMACRNYIFQFFPFVAAIWITCSLQNGCKSLQIRVLGGILAPFCRSFLLPWDDIWALQLSTSLVWLPLGAKLCSQSPPRPFLERFLVPKSSNFLQI